ncbi:MAG: AAA family ATPase [Euryarchaeota archaeon]|nr:AAA family ATPase [Euryarchaeota archaeon]
MVIDIKLCGEDVKATGGRDIQTFLDEWIAVKLREKEKREREPQEARPARYVRLRPRGYPLRDVSRASPLSITDERLFEIYAKEQWLGATVSKGDILFDQRLIPDYAFEVVKVLPRGEVTITEDTRIHVEKPEPEAKPVARVSFSDIIGHEDVKRKCRIVMKYLLEPRRFGEWAPKNVLFYGPPGTGKTMTAKALANETDARLFLVRATDLIGEYVGDGSKRIHELYLAAKEASPSVVFIDELDAIGLDRSYQSIRGDVSEVVNALLTELEGIHENAGVVTIAATNNPALLDRALRSRFEEEIPFRLPTERERYEILRHYAAKLPLRVEADLREFAKRTPNFSGRDLKDKLLKVALHRAILEDSPVVRREHLEYALRRIPAMPEPRELYV